MLERDRWEARLDSGWDEHDLTIYGDRFSKVVVRTVAENHGGDKRLLRGRLEAGWTLLGKISFWLVVATLVLIGRMLRAVLLSQASLPLWADWLLPFIAPLLVLLWVGYLRMRTQRTMRLGLALLDVVAQELGLTKLVVP
jgi:hypothetical protein